MLTGTDLSLPRFWQGNAEALEKPPWQKSAAARDDTQLRLFRFTSDSKPAVLPEWIEWTLLGHLLHKWVSKMRIDRIDLFARFSLYSRFAGVHLTSPHFGGLVRLLLKCRMALTTPKVFYACRCEIWGSDGVLLFSVYVILLICSLNYSSRHPPSSSTRSLWSGSMWTRSSQCETVALKTSEDIQGSSRHHRQWQT